MSDGLRKASEERETCVCDQCEIFVYNWKSGVTCVKTEENALYIHERTGKAGVLVSCADLGIREVIATPPFSLKPQITPPFKDAPPDGAAGCFTCAAKSQAVEKEG